MPKKISCQTYVTDKWEVPWEASRLNQSSNRIYCLVQLNKEHPDDSSKKKKKKNPRQSLEDDQISSSQSPEDDQISSPQSLEDDIFPHPRVQRTTRFPHPRVQRTTRFPHPQIKSKAKSRSRHAKIQNPQIHKRGLEVVPFNNSRGERVTNLPKTKSQERSDWEIHSKKALLICAINN